MLLIDDLKEAYWGIKEGQPKKDMSWIMKWRTSNHISGHPDDAIKNGESYDRFRDRVFRALETVLNLPSPLLIVSHGGVYWPIQEYLSLPFADIQNAIPIFHRAPAHGHDKWQPEPLTTENHLDYEFE